MAKDDAGAVGEIAARSARSPSSVLAPDVDPRASATAGEAGKPAPDISATKAAIEKPSSRSISITIIAVLATLYTLYFAREFSRPDRLRGPAELSPQPADSRRWRASRFRRPLARRSSCWSCSARSAAARTRWPGPHQAVAASAPQTLRRRTRSCAR